MDHASPRDHGGDLSALMARHGGCAEEWLDLSTGINPLPYPVPAVSGLAWSRLPTKEVEAALIAVARRAYGAAEGCEMTPAPGAQALIESLPEICAPGRCAVVSPTYNEHAAAFRAHGWSVAEIPAPEAGYDALVVVNPNNPDGRLWRPERLLEIARGGGLVIVDESFMDATPMMSMAGRAGAENLVILRSFGKFYGLAGLRLGFALTGPQTAARLRARLGLWAVSGPALEIGAAALKDDDWALRTRARLISAAARLDGLLAGAGLTLKGGTPLFRLAAAPEAADIAERLAARRIAVRRFPYAPDWLRFGLPGSEQDWARLTEALACR